MRWTLAVIGLSLLTAWTAACDGGEVTTTSGSGGSGGEPGTGGTSTSDGGTTTSSSSTTTHPSCLEAVTLEPVHGCDPATNLTDMTGMSEVTIGYGYVDNTFIYEPKCVLVDSGTTVVMEALDGSNFQIHPLQGGTAPTADPDSPFGFIADPDVSTASFTLDACGTFPYYCVAHTGAGMVGAVYVQKP